MMVSLHENVLSDNVWVSCDSLLLHADICVESVFFIPFKFSLRTDVNVLPALVLIILLATSNFTGRGKRSGICSECPWS